MQTNCSFSGDALAKFASPQQKIQRFKITSPDLKMFVHRFENFVDWSKIKDEDDLRKSVQGLVSSLWDKIDYSRLGKQRELKEQATAGEDVSKELALEEKKGPTLYARPEDVDLKREFEHAPNDPQMQRIRRMYEEASPESKKRAMSEFLKEINKGKRESFEGWWKYVNDTYGPRGQVGNYPGFAYSLLKPVFEKSPPGTKNPPPPVSPPAVAALFEHVQDEFSKPKPQLFNMLKTYNKKSREIDRIEAGGSGEKGTKWVKVPGRESDPENFGENVDKLSRLATGTNWCIRQPNMARSYLERGDFYLYIEDDNTKVAVRTEGPRRIAEISNHDQFTPAYAYWEEILKFLKEGNFDYENNPHYRTLREMENVNKKVATDPEYRKEFIGSFGRKPGNYQKLSKELRKDPEIRQAAIKSFSRALSRKPTKMWSLIPKDLKKEMKEPASKALLRAIKRNPAELAEGNSWTKLPQELIEPMMPQIMDIYAREYGRQTGEMAIPPGMEDSPEFHEMAKKYMKKNAARIQSPGESWMGQEKWEQLPVGLKNDPELHAIAKKNWIKQLKNDPRLVSTTDVDVPREFFEDPKFAQNFQQLEKDAWKQNLWSSPDTAPREELMSDPGFSQEVEDIRYPAAISQARQKGPLAWHTEQFEQYRNQPEFSEASKQSYVEMAERNPAMVMPRHFAESDPAFAQAFQEAKKRGMLDLARRNPAALVAFKDQLEKDPELYEQIKAALLEEASTPKPMSNEEFFMFPQEFVRQLMERQKASIARYVPDPSDKQVSEIRWLYSNPEGYSPKHAKTEQERAVMEQVAKDGLLARLRRPSRPPTGENIPREILADEQFMASYRSELASAWARWVEKHPTEMERVPDDLKDDPRIARAHESGWGQHYEHKLLADPVGIQEQVPESIRENPEFSAKRRELWRGLAEQYPSYKHIYPKDMA